MITISEIILMSTCAGTVKAGLNKFKSLFENRTDLKDKLSITDDEVKILDSTIELMNKIYKTVKSPEMIREAE